MIDISNIAQYLFGNHELNGYNLLAENVLAGLHFRAPESNEIKM
jgi:hypothetical protein